MANIRKIIDIANITIDKKAYKCTSVGVDLDRDEITINYDVHALNSSDTSLFVHSRGTVLLTSANLGDSDVSAFITAMTTMIQTRLPNV